MEDKNYRNAIILCDKKDVGKDIPIGASKMGGFPDLPPEIEYPTMTAHTEKFLKGCNSKTDRYEKSAMQLVAQINLYELAETGADVDNLLPKKGMIYIFWSGEIMTLESDEYVEIHCDEPEMKDIQKVIYWDGDMSTLRRTQPPCPYYSKYFENNITEECFPECAVDFSEQREYDCDDDDENFDSDKIFGFPYGVNKPWIKDDEVNLFQFDCYSIFEGCIWYTYWIMKQRDLKKLDFSHITLDCDMD
ncbi:MAG: DUF1963 domain-containing protein [Ruminococcus sp.]|nr:DUF1963 domain-containing protein [Ruminococcus sp.]